MQVPGKLLATGLLLAVSAIATATDFPSRPVKVVSTAAPGGAFDVAGRLVTERMAKELGTAVVFENRQGASGLIAAQAVSRAAPDGYTWLFSDQSLFTLASHPTETQRAEAVRALVPISMVTSVPFALAVNPSLNVRTVGEFIQHARQNPNVVKYGTVHEGSVFKLGMDMLSEPPLPLFGVPYKSGPQAINALIAGEIDAMVMAPAAAKQMAEGGRLRVLAVTSQAAMPLLPGVPPVAATVPGYRLEAWNGMFAPRGIDPAIQEKMEKALRTALEDPAVRQALAKSGIAGAPSTPAEFASRIAMERDRNIASEKK